MLIRRIFRKIKNLGKLAIKSISYHKLHKNIPSIISNNCSGVFLYKEFGCKYLSPTINLQLSPSDYLKFCKINIDSFILCIITYIIGFFVSFFICKIPTNSQGNWLIKST